MPLYMATASEGHISSGSKPVRNLCVGLRDQTARVRCEGLNVSLRSLCLRFNSCLALAALLNHHRLSQLLSALPKKDRQAWEALPLSPPQAHFTPLPSPLPLWFFWVLGLLILAYFTISGVNLFFLEISIQPIQRKEHMSGLLSQGIRKLWIEIRNKWRDDLTYNWFQSERFVLYMLFKDLGVRTS